MTQTPLPESGEGWRADSVVIRTESGSVLDCVTRRPAADSGRMAAVFIAGGMRTGKRAALAAGPAFGGVVMACDYPWRNPGEHGAAGILLRLTRIRSDIVATPAAHRSAADWLLAQPWVDTTRFAGVGVSLGVPMVAAWAADDPRVKAVALLYGGARIGLLLDHSQQRNVPQARIRGPLARLAAWGLAPLEPATTVPRIAPRPLFLAVAGEDRRIPIEATDALVAAAGSGARIMRLAGGHVTADAEALIHLITDSTAAWLRGVWGAATVPR